MNAGRVIDAAVSSAAAPSVVLICPDPENRHALAGALAAQGAALTREFSMYPANGTLHPLFEPFYDAALVEIDSNTDAALQVIEALGSHALSSTVVAYSKSADPETLVRCMRAGAREFLTHPVSAPALSEALLRAAARRTDITGLKRLSSKVLVFWGSKGGAGVSTLAANFAIALRRESGAEVALLDLHPDLGDISVLLSMKPAFSLTDALSNPERIDQSFLETLLGKHNSGIAVLAAPDAYTSVHGVEGRAVEKLLHLARDRFPYVVVDGGPALGAAAEHLFRAASTIYLVSQMDIPSLRNAQRFLEYAQRFGETEVQIVLNRFDNRHPEFDEARLTKALGAPVAWKVPNDFAAVSHSVNIGAPLILQNSAVARGLQQMATAACGKAVVERKRKGFRLFGREG